MRKTKKKIIPMFIVTILLFSVCAVPASASVMPGNTYCKLSPVHYIHGYASTVLNVATNGYPGQNTNVTLWSPTGDYTQAWIFRQGSDGYWRLHTRKNEQYALNVWRGASNYFNCDVHTWADNLKDSAVASLDKGQYLISLDLQHYSGSLGNGSSTSWQSGSNIKWLINPGHTWRTLSP